METESHSSVPFRFMSHNKINWAKSPVGWFVLWRFQALDNNLSAWRIPSETLASLGNCLAAQSASLML